MVFVRKDILMPNQRRNVNALPGVRKDGNAAPDTAFLCSFLVKKYLTALVVNPIKKSYLKFYFMFLNPLLIFFQFELHILDRIWYFHT